MKLQHLGKGSWYIKSTLFKSFLNWNKIFKNSKEIIGKTPFFARDTFCTPHSISFNVGFWQGGFAGKRCVFIPRHFNKKNNTSIFWNLPISKKESYWKFVVPFFRTTNPLFVGFKIKLLKKRFPVLTQKPT